MAKKGNITKQQREMKMKRAYELWMQGETNTEICRLVDISQTTCVKYVKQFLAQQPIAQMTREEREVAIWQEWQELGKQIQREIDEQRSRGRVKVTRTRHPDGTETIEQTVVSGADPNLLKALGQHLDRKARQLLDQMPVADSTQNVQINLVKDFLNQADNSSRQLTAEDWNSKQTIDVPARTAH